MTMTQEERTPRPDARYYTRQEITEASGLRKTVVQYRICALQIHSTKYGYSYEDVKKILQYRNKRPGTRKASQKNIDALKRALRNDGLI